MPMMMTALLAGGFALSLIALLGALTELAVTNRRADQLKAELQELKGDQP